MKSLALLITIFVILPSISTLANQNPQPTSSDYEALCLSKEKPDACYWAANAKEAKGDMAGAERFFRMGCDLGSLQSCHGWASNLELNGAHDEALKISTQNCERGYTFSCETAGYILKKQGKIADARTFYLKMCSSKEGTRGCDQLAEVSKSEADRKDLQMRCKDNNPWACLAWGMAEKSSGNTALALSVFIEGCRQYPNSRGLCASAAQLIQVPSDVEEYVRAEEGCYHWRGEEGYNEGRRRQIEEGFKSACTDRRQLFESLMKKYATDPRIVFKLEQTRKLNKDLH